MKELVQDVQALKRKHCKGHELSHDLVGENSDGQVDVVDVLAAVQKLGAQ